MEVRGIGIINVAAMHQMHPQRERVDLIITLKVWEDVPDVDRLGMEDQHVEILGIKIPISSSRCAPGDCAAREVAYQTKLKQSGYNPAKELNDRSCADGGEGSLDGEQKRKNVKTSVVRHAVFPFQVRFLITFTFYDPASSHLRSKRPSPPPKTASTIPVFPLCKYLTALRLVCLEYPDLLPQPGEKR
jgi:hypothetical protein